MKRLLLILSVIWLAGCNNQTYEKALEKGNLALENGEYDKAQLAFEIALEENPKDEEVKTLYDQLLDFNEVEEAMEQARWEEAVSQANQMLQKDSLESGLKVELENYVNKAEMNINKNKAVVEAIEKIKILASEGKFSESKRLIDELQQNGDVQDVLIVYSNELKETSDMVSKGLEEMEEAEQLAAQKEAEQVSSSKKGEYINKLNGIEKGLADLDYLYEKGVTTEIKEALAETYRRWDEALNEVYGVLKQQFSKKEMEDLRAEQRQWIVFRDDMAEKEASAFKGGTWESVQYLDTQARLTKERCYELVEVYMK